MAHQDTIYSWYCPYCHDMFRDREEAIKHTATCKRNPANKHCGWCLHACVRGERNYITMHDCYCGYHKKSYCSRPWSIDCERKINEEGKLKPVPHTCTHFTYKGDYYWTPIKEYEDALTKYEQLDKKPELPINQATLDVICAGEDVWRCDYCNTTWRNYETKELAEEHEKGCSYSPMGKRCQTCVHSGLHPNKYGYFKVDDEHMSAWCSYFNQSIFYHRPYYIECEEKENMWGDKVKIEHTCKHYEYKGYYGWREKDGGDA